MPPPQKKIVRGVCVSFSYLLCSPDHGRAYLCRTAFGVPSAGWFSAGFLRWSLWCWNLCFGGIEPGRIWQSSGFLWYSPGFSSYSCFSSPAVATLPDFDKDQPTCSSICCSLCGRPYRASNIRLIFLEWTFPSQIERRLDSGASRWFWKAISWWAAWCRVDAFLQASCPYLPAVAAAWVAMGALEVSLKCQDAGWISHCQSQKGC